MAQINMVYVQISTEKFLLNAKSAKKKNFIFFDLQLYPANLKGRIEYRPTQVCFLSRVNGVEIAFQNHKQKYIYFHFHSPHPAICSSELHSISLGVGWAFAVLGLKCCHLKICRVQGHCIDRTENSLSIF